MSRYRVTVVEKITRHYEIGGCDTDDQAMKLAEEECEDGDESHKVGDGEYEYESYLTPDAAPASAGPLDIVTRAIQAIGQSHFCPEGIEALRDYVHDRGWHGLGVRAGVDPVQLHQAYDQAMEMMRQLFAPVGSDD